ncbi:hypothetical protein KFE96_12420 [Kordiimonas sp. SCSIO 12603]|uniref:hypothetical protein n=1 Tax=Kordiimonas sp. SCSIO 12603 TaxID=2829596 RepID=UPI0021037ABA|nr:hypothetical protein [Kordiimonas sp. SCSIO 12603]UTW57641.1 hypothetical protein KFE96_12420 [Kordiimonas sp. SCSIO 12603]
MKSNKTFLKLALACSLPFAAVAAQAGDSGSNGLKDWAQEAGEAVNTVMNAPTLYSATGSGAGLALYQVTIDRDGDVVDAIRVKKPSDMGIRAAARKVLRKVDFPDLPASYNQDKLTFVLQLSYATSDEQAEKFLRQGYVTSQQIAQNSDTIRVVAQNIN